MDCVRCREAISARLDGEEIGELVEALESHVTGCAACRRFEVEAIALNRQVRISPAPPIPDRTGELVTAMIGSASSWRLDVVRALLIGLAAVEFFGGMVALLGADGGAIPVHTTRELGGFGLALGVGLFLAALRPGKIAGLLPVVVTLALTSVLGAVIDVAGGQVALIGEAHHLLEVAAVVVLWRLTRPAVRSHTGRMLPTS